MKVRGVAHSLERTLARRFVLIDDPVPLGERSVRLLRPRAPEDLISEEEFERDERLPYWADVWPSSVVLASLLPAAPPGARCLELGCGLGLVTTEAMRAGWDVLATDYYDDALLFARVNAMRETGREPLTRNVDWRALPADLGRFELVVAADVLYERPYAGMVADALGHTMAPGGSALIADPGRVAVESFLTECEERDIATVHRTTHEFTAGEIRQEITIYTLQAR